VPGKAAVRERPHFECRIVAARHRLHQRLPRRLARSTLKLAEVMLDPVTFREFEAAARAQGFSEVLEREWAPLSALETHVHAFAVKALVVHGEMWLTVGQSTRHLQAGDTFELDSDVPHAERYGSEGATYWVARRSGAASEHT
jgi:AraC-like ligand binding domain